MRHVCEPSKLARVRSDFEGFEVVLWTLQVFPLHHPPFKVQYPDAYDPFSNLAAHPKVETPSV